MKALIDARDLLRDLQGQTAALQQQAVVEAQALQQAQQANRSGASTLNQVVSAQGRYDAAQGVLGLHLREVEQQQAVVAALEQQQGAQQAVDLGAAAQRDLQQARSEAAQVVADFEQQVVEAGRRFQALQQTFSAAQRSTWAQAQAHVAQALGLTPAEVFDALRWDNGGVQISGRLGVERRAQVEQAVEVFAQQVGTSARELIATANGAGAELSAGRLFDLLPRR